MRDLLSMKDSNTNLENVTIDARDAVFILKDKLFNPAMMAIAPITPALIVSGKPLTFAFLLLVAFDFYFGAARVCRKYIPGFLKLYFAVLYVFFGLRLVIEFSGMVPYETILFAAPIALFFWGRHAYQTFAKLRSLAQAQQKGAS